MTESRVFDILLYYPERHPEQKVALAKKENGIWRKYSIQEYIDLTRKISYAFIELGIKAGDKIGIISGNRPEWNMLDMATMLVGAITVPIYPTMSKDDYNYILNNSEAKFVILEGQSVLNKLEEIRSETVDLKYIYTFQDRGKYPFFDQLLKLGEEHPHEAELNSRMDAVKPEGCATIIYTSGTTGMPKGVMLSHNNIMGQIRNLASTPAKDSKTAFSFLPLCHAYERTIVFLYQYLGMSVYYAESLATIASDMREIHPTMMSAVPRLLEKMYDKISQSGKSQSWPARAIFNWALHLAENYKISPENRTWWYNQKLKLADKLVYKKIRKNLGAEHFDIIISGAASIQSKIASFFSAIKMPVYEGYGLTETSPVIATSNKLKNGREVGTVGQALGGVEIKIFDNGEVCCRGHNVMMGYYKNEELTKQVIDKDGWFHTGDLGYINDKGQLFLTGRIKNLFKTSMGKYINPQHIEDKFSESTFIENIVVFGENQKYAAALIVPDFSYLKGWCKQNNLTFTSPSEIIKIKEVKERFAKEIQDFNAFFGDTEKIKKYELISDEWSIANGILTPTLKVKRNVVQSRYQLQIIGMFTKAA